MLLLCIGLPTFYFKNIDLIQHQETDPGQLVYRLKLHFTINSNTNQIRINMNDTVSPFLETELLLAVKFTYLYLN